MTEGGKAPLPSAEGQGHSTVGKDELRDILQRSIVQLRGTKMLDSAVQEGTAGNRFVDKNKQVDVSPAPKRPAGRPGAGPGGRPMLKR